MQDARQFQGAVDSSRTTSTAQQSDSVGSSSDVAGAPGLSTGLAFSQFSFASKATSTTETRTSAHTPKAPRKKPNRPKHYQPRGSAVKRAKYAGEREYQAENLVGVKGIGDRDGDEWTSEEQVGLAESQQQAVENAEAAETLTFLASGDAFSSLPHNA